METQSATHTPLPRHIDVLDEACVHQLRKSTKQLRARLQLHRNLEGTRQDKEELRTAVKQLARELATQRDNDVMRSLMDELGNETTDPAVLDLLARLKRGLDGRDMPPQDLKAVRSLVSRIARKSTKLDNPPFGDELIASYLDARLEKLLAEGGPLLADNALAGNDWEGLHDWRKGIKKLLFQIPLKRQMNDTDRIRLENLDALGGTLGQINDLSMLANYVRDPQLVATRPPELDAVVSLLALIDRHRQTHLARCRLLYHSLRGT